MPNHALNSWQSQKVERGHGKIGYVALNVTVSPEMKDALISRAIESETSVMHEVRLALANYLGVDV